MPRLPLLSALCSFLALPALGGCSNKGATPSSTTPSDAGAETDESELPKCALAVSKGPWVVAVDGASAKVRWESCKAGGGAITFAPELSAVAGTRVESTVSQATIAESHEVPLRKTGDWAGTYFMHEVALGSLAPATCYAYALEQDATAKGRFCTARAPGTGFRFASIGDTNPGFGDLQTLLRAVYDQKPDFTVHVGDIQYYASGLESYGSWMDLMRPMLRGGAFFPAIGNHEFEKPLERAEYVERFWGNPGFDGDTDAYRFESGGVWFFAMNTEIPMDPKSAQGARVQANLADAAKRPGYRFSVVFLHRPFVTCGDTGQLDGLRKEWQPIFAAQGVKLVLQGHMHGYERFDLDGITWLTTAGGGALLGKIDANVARPESAARKASGAFWNATLFEVKPGKLLGTTYDDKAAVRDTFELAVP
jgi:hypothetical protein